MIFDMPATAQRKTVFWDRRTETLFEVPESAHELEGFREWIHSIELPQCTRVSFLNGELQVDMSPESLETHNKCNRGLYAGWERCMAEEDVGELIVDGMLLINDDASLSTESDGMICLYESIRAGRVAYRERVDGSGRFVEVVGSPDVTAEIVSSSSVRKDTLILMDLYYVAGVGEYWLIDARKSEIDFRIYARGETAFVAVEPDAEGFSKSAVLNRRFRMTRTRNPVGGWRYTLEFLPLAE